MAKALYRVVATLIWDYVLAALLVVLAITGARAAPVVTLPMSFTVDHTGAATLSVPINAPPGTNGMTPHISLNYSSSQANGFVGVGWTLSGFPAITRCPKTIVTNGAASPVSFANGTGGSDAFCFIGEPLVQDQQQSAVGQAAPQGQQFTPGGQLIGLSGSYYGADKAVYTTEIEQLARIVSYSAAGYTGPSSFLMYSRGGLIYEFGATTTSQVGCGAVCPGTVVMTWMLDKVTDTFGNSLSITYIQSGARAYPLEIDYTANAGLTAQNRIQFTYAPRTDTPLQFFAGVELQTAYRLNGIQTQVLKNGKYTAVSNYVLLYEYGAVTGRSRLKTITENGLSGAELLPASFTYCDLCNAPADLLASFTNGLAGSVSQTQPGSTTISYQLTTHSSVYPTGYASVTYPNQALVIPRYVVQQVSAPNVTGTGYTVTPYAVIYQYFNGLTNLVGRGFLGFGEVCATDAQTLLQNCTYYNQTYPNIGNANEVKLIFTTNAVVVQDVVKAYGTFSPYNGRPSANTSYASSIITTGQDLAGNPMPTTTQTFGSNGGVDSYGNILNMTKNVQSSLGGSLTTDYTTTGAYTYGNDLANWQVVSFGSTPVNWLIGRLEQSNVSAAYTDGRGSQYSSTSGPRVINYVPSPTTGAITQKTVQPTGTSIPNIQSGAGFTLVSNIAQDAYGNQKQVIESAPDDTIPVPPYSVLPSRETDTVWGSANDPGYAFPDSTKNGLQQMETRIPDLRFMLPESITDINNQTTLYAYDDFGRKTSETLNDSSAIAITYYACPNSPTLNVLSNQLTTCPAGAQYAIQTTHTGQDKSTTMSPTTIVYYDSLDRDIDTDTEAFDGSMSQVTKTYNAQLQLASISRPYFSGATPETTSYTYDALNRITRTNYPDSSYATTAYYETFKTVVAGINGGFPGETTIKIYDGDGNLLNTKQYPVAGSTSNEIDTNFVYDGFDNLSWIIDNAGNVTRYYYDSLSRKDGINDPDAGNRLQSYTAYSDPGLGGNGYDSADYNQYDQLARLTSRCWTTPGTSVDEYTCANPSNSEVLETWSYDPTYGIGEQGGETSTQGTKSSTAYTYNSLGQKLTGTYVVGTGGTAKTFAYSYYYDTNHRPSYYTSPGGSAPQTNYAASSYISGVSHHGGTAMWTVASRDAELHLTGATFGSAAPTSAVYSYSPVTGNETGLTMAPSGSQTYLVNLAYGWDQLDNLISRTDSVNNLQEVYCYDGLNRLVVIQLATACQNGNPVELSLVFDSLGDPTTKSDIGVYSYPMPGSPQPHGVQSIAPAGGGGTISFAYDTVGKMTSDGLTADSLTYLPYQMPLTVAHSGGDTITMQYDADHNRVMRQVNGGSPTYYLPDGIATGTNPLSLTYTTYFMGDGQRVAQDSGNGGATHRYFLNDFQNSIGLVTNDSGATVQNLAFDAFGKPRNPNGTSDPSFGAGAVTPRGYINQEMLRDVQLIDLNARYYDPALARFLTADPVIADKDDGQAWNAYEYSHNNPMSGEDPTGLACGGSSSSGSTESITVCAPPRLALVLPGGAVVTHGREYNRAIDAYRHPNSAAARHFASMGTSFKAAGMATPSADNDSDDYPDIGSAAGLQRGILPANGMRDALLDFEKLVGPTAALQYMLGGIELKAAEGGLEGANFAQRTFSAMFSKGGTFAGRSVEDVAGALRSGALNPADVPVQYIVRDGNSLILNTRSAQALEQAGIPRGSWNAINMTGDAAAEARLTGQLGRNGLTSQGIPTVVPGGN
jgi:RHS repeat-associated protein